MMQQQHALKPRKGTKFMKRDVEKMIAKLLSEKVGERKYVYEESLPLSKELCAMIQQEVQRMGYERYKLVVQVNVIEAASQGIRIASRCLWDPDVDNYAEYTFTNPYMHVNAIVFGLYWE